VLLTAFYLLYLRFILRMRVWFCVKKTICVMAMYIYIFACVCVRVCMCVYVVDIWRSCGCISDE